jgi:hypothetical protein
MNPNQLMKYLSRRSLDWIEFINIIDANYDWDQGTWDELRDWLYIIRGQRPAIIESQNEIGYLLYKIPKFQYTSNPNPTEIRTYDYSYNPLTGVYISSNMDTDLQVQLWRDMEDAGEMSIIHYNINGIEIEFSIPYLRYFYREESGNDFYKIISIQDYLENVSIGEEDDWDELELVSIPKYISLEYIGSNFLSFNYPGGVS